MFGVFFDGFADPRTSVCDPCCCRTASRAPAAKSFQLARASKTWPGGKEPGEGYDTAKSPSPNGCRPRASRRPVGE